MHPEFLLRLRAEILDKVGAAKIPTYDDVKEMKFLRAVINGKHLFQSVVTDSLKKSKKR